jgi:hypothetical protein
MLYNPLRKRVTLFSNHAYLFAVRHTEDLLALTAVAPDSSTRQRLRGVRPPHRLQHVAGQAAPHDPVRREARDGQQHGDVWLHPVPADLRGGGGGVRVGARIGRPAAQSLQAVSRVCTHPDVGE